MTIFIADCLHGIVARPFTNSNRTTDASYKNGYLHRGTVDRGKIRHKTCCNIKKLQKPSVSGQIHNKRRRGRVQNCWMSRNSVTKSSRTVTIQFYTRYLLFFAFRLLFWSVTLFVIFMLSLFLWFSVSFFAAAATFAGWGTWWWGSPTAHQLAFVGVGSRAWWRIRRAWSRTGTRPTFLVLLPETEHVCNRELRVTEKRRLLFQLFLPFRIFLC